MDVNEARQILEAAREEMHAMRKRNDAVVAALPLPDSVGPDLLGPLDDLAKQKLVRDIRNGGADEKS